MNHSELSSTTTSARTAPAGSQTRVKLTLAGEVLDNADKIRVLTGLDYDAIVEKALERYLRTLNGQNS